MKNKIVGIFIFMLLITTVIPVVGQLKDISIIKNGENKNIPLIEDKWSRIYGGKNLDVGCYATETSDGGYILIGATRSYGAGGEDFWLLKTDNQGLKEWEKFYGGSLNDFGSDVQQTSDGGYILTGSTESYGNGKDDVWLIKTDSIGNKIWDKTFGDYNFDGGCKVRETNDGGFVIIGNVDATGGPRSDIWLIKTDNNGNKIWDKKFGGKGHNWASSIDLTTDGGYVIVGSSFILGETEDYDIWLIKTDSSGNLLWDKKYESNNSDSGFDIQQTTDGGYILVGNQVYYQNCKIWLIKTDEKGDFVWDNNYSYADDTRGASVRQTAEGGYIIIGYTLEENIYGFNMVLVKIDSNGDKEWDHYLKKIGHDLVVAVEQTLDAGYILTGEYTSSILQKNGDLWVLKIDSNGNIPDVHSKKMIKQRMFNLFPNLFRFLQIFNLDKI